MAEKTKEQIIAEIKEKLDDFSKRTIRMYELVEEFVDMEFVDIRKSFDEKNEELKSFNLCKAREYELFDRNYKKMCDDIEDKFDKEKVDPESLDILQNVLYEDDRIDGKMMFLVLTTWCLANIDTYPDEALCLSMDINCGLNKLKV